jgi:hypothetical protein
MESENLRLRLCAEDEMIAWDRMLYLRGDACSLSPSERPMGRVFKSLDSYPMGPILVEENMKPKILALLAIALVAVASPAMIALASGVSHTTTAAHTNHSADPDRTAQCTFTHPTSLPSQASANARDALADRSSHCPPTHPTR